MGERDLRKEGELPENLSAGVNVCWFPSKNGHIHGESLRQEERGKECQIYFVKSDDPTDRKLENLSDEGKRVIRGTGTGGRFKKRVRSGE